MPKSTKKPPFTGTGGTFDDLREYGNKSRDFLRLVTFYPHRPVGQLYDMVNDPYELN